jgi:hypothetical protein
MYANGHLSFTSHRHRVVVRAAATHEGGALGMGGVMGGFMTGRANRQPADPGYSAWRPA